MTVVMTTSLSAGWPWLPGMLLGVVTACAAEQAHVYKTVEGRDLKLYVQRPADWQAGDRRPAIVFFHGGGFVGGNPRQFENQAAHLARRGAVTFEVEYRLLPRGSRELPTRCIQDAKSAMRWVRRHAVELGVDPQRIASAGGSAGGHLAAFVGLVEGLDDAAEDRSVSAKANAMLLFNPVLDNGPGGWGHDRVGERYREFSPFHNVTSNAPPAIVMAGSADNLVPVATLRAFQEAMQRAGARCETRIYEGQPHGFFNFGRNQNRFYRETLMAVDDFLVSLGWLAPAPRDSSLTGTAPSAAPGAEPAPQPSSAPNILYLLCDDLGYGDIRYFNPAGKIPTPHLDRLAAAGMVFTDAHSGSSVCTPTRYGILTGRYSWRTRLQNGVLNGFSKPLIAPDRLTVPALLQRHGYHTACIGKWHLGLDWPLPSGGNLARDGDSRRIDYRQPIRNGPTQLGFDYYFGISASLDMPPFVFIENDRVTSLPATEKTWIRTGPAAADFEAMEVLPTLTRKAVEYLGRRAAQAQAGRPFFLYVPFTSPHTPCEPTPEWRGRSGLNVYADFVMQTDASVGEILAALDRHQLASNTLVIATSDNGCSPAAKMEELAAKGHQPSHIFRGAKADIFEGGHRIPFIVRWPGKIRPGSTNTQTVCLTDLLATCAELVGTPLPPNAGEDSVSLLPAFLGKDTPPLREATVHHSINGSFAIRQANWKLIFCPGSGGWSNPKPGSPAEKGLPPVQLYNLAADPGETHNLQAARPELTRRLTDLMERYIAQGRSTPGPAQRNDVHVELYKPARAR